MLKGWKHSGFSIESETRLLSKADREALGQYVVRGANSAEKIHYDTATDRVTWKQSHPLQPQSTQEAQPETVDLPEVPDAWSKLRRQSWARLLQKVYEVDPFICPKCQGTMSVVAVIEDPAELTRIIDWAKQQEKNSLLSVCARSPPELAVLSE